MRPLLAVLAKPLFTDAAMANLSLTGSVLIFCVGANLIWGKKFRVANMLPALVFAVAWAFLIPKMGEFGGDILGWLWSCLA